MNNKNVNQTATAADSAKAAKSANFAAKAKELNKAFDNAVRTTPVVGADQAVKSSQQTQPQTYSDSQPNTATQQQSLGQSQVQQQAQTDTQPVAQNQTQKQVTTQPQQTPSNGYTYDEGTDYQALIDAAVSAGNYQLAAIYEQQSNAKIQGMGIEQSTTNNYSSYLPSGNGSGNVTGENKNDLSPMINQIYDAVEQKIKTNLNYETQAAADQLRRAYEDAQGTYEDAIAQQLIETKQARDAKALRNQINGDRGGIGSAQVDSIYNTGAKNREAIANQQRQLSTDTARQLADLRAKGKYEEANQLLQSTQQRLAALYDEQVRLQQAEETQRSSLASLASSYLSAGIMPNQQMLDALGIDAATARLYVDYAKAAAKKSSYTGGTPLEVNNGGENGGDKIVAVTDAKDLSPAAKAALSLIDTRVNSAEQQAKNLEVIASLVNPSGIKKERTETASITPEEAAYLVKIAGLATDDELDGFVRELWTNLGQKWPYE